MWLSMTSPFIMTNILLILILLNPLLLIPLMNFLPPLHLLLYFNKLHCRTCPSPQINVLPVSHPWFILSLNKRTNTTPLSDTKTSPSNYRPTSPTSTIIKVVERMIRKQVIAFLTIQDHLNNRQHGFRSGRSCFSDVGCL